MSIELGISRISKLLSHAGSPHNLLNCLHVAGTNGKGSVCSYLASALQCSTTGGTPVRVGKFTSPHLIHITDSITINNIPISLAEFSRIRTCLEATNANHGLKCTEFELLACTAFQYFHESKCNWCVVEVGLGGRLDATNVIPGRNKICGITKIGMDHEGFLGSTLGQIAAEKAGIITEGVPFVCVDGTNEPQVVHAIQQQAQRTSTAIMLTVPPSKSFVDTKSWGQIDLTSLPLNGDYQISNVSVALGMLDYLQTSDRISLTRDQLLQGIYSVKWPGRLQLLDFHYEKDRSLPVLLDGAHNGSAAIELAKYLDQVRPNKDHPLTFVIAVTKGKKLSPLLAPILKNSDRVIVTKFGAVDRMPWIEAMDANELAQEIRSYTKNVSIQPDLQQVLPQLAEEKCDREVPVIICGSLYLCGQLLRKHNDNV